MSECRHTVLCVNNFYRGCGRALCGAATPCTKKNKPIENPNNKIPTGHRVGKMEIKDLPITKDEMDEIEARR